MAPCVLTSLAKMIASTFDAIQSGMTVDQVNQLIGGRGKLDSASDIAGHHTEIRMWTGQDIGANANLTFQDGKVVSKAQFGLR